MGKILATLALAAISTTATGAPRELVNLAHGPSASSQASTTPASTNAMPEGVWLAWGGEVSLTFNPDALAALDMHVADIKSASQRSAGQPGRVFDSTTFSTRDAGALEVLHQGPAISGIGGGELHANGGLVLSYPGGQVDLRGFVVRADPGTRLGLVVTDVDGTVWFHADHAHYGFDPKAPGIFQMFNMNLELSSHLANLLGRPELAGYALGGLGLRANSHARKEPEIPAGGVCSTPFSGAGLSTDIAMIFDDGAHSWTAQTDSVEVRRCGLPPLPNGGACTAVSTNGKVIIDQDSSLRNIGTAAVAWYDKFNNDEGGVPQPPYNNDQHPFLIWNLYRVDADGRIKQIGVSGMKHAFLTINWAHTAADCGCDPGHVIYPTCEDTYSRNNNDNLSTTNNAQNNLGPRSELIPSTAQWGRCGSVWDPNCDGQGPDSGTPSDHYLYRMQVTENDMLPPLSTGSHYYFEYWYIVRDDSNIYNTMAYREIQPQKTGTDWLGTHLVNADAADHDFFIGPLINRWVDPAAPAANTLNKELVTPLGHARVAVKATDLGGGQWRYEYAVMNFDYAHAQIDPAHPSEPNMKLLSNQGFARFSIPLQPGSGNGNFRFDDADGDAGNDWTVAIGADAVTWSAPVSGNTLDWGTLYHFEFTSNAPPAANVLTVVGAATSAEAELPYTLALLGPQAVADDTIFKNGFDSSP
ncbi:MAG: hypothetical protein ABIO49_13115 [Dokdonella sp.]